MTSSIESSNYECIHNLRSQIATSSNDKHGGLRYMPYVFTESGVSMLSSVLRSQKATLRQAQGPNGMVRERFAILPFLRTFAPRY